MWFRTAQGRKQGKGKPYGGGQARLVVKKLPKGGETKASDRFPSELNQYWPNFIRKKKRKGTC